MIQDISLEGLIHKLHVSRWLLWYLQYNNKYINSEA